MRTKTRRAAEAHATSEYPRESCGLVVSTLKGERYFPCRNTSASPNEHFSLHKDDWVDAQRAGEIVGLVHSHPGYPPVPSPGDLSSCEATQLEWHIVRVDLQDEFDPESRVVATGWHSWKPNGYRAPLVGRSFHYGVLDCYALARDWYREELGVELADVVHGPDRWWDDLESDFSPYEDPENYERAGLVRLDAGVKLENGDLVVMQVRSKTGKPNHVGIITDNQRCIMLHHLHGALSERTVYGGFWREATRFVLRRKA